MSETTFPFTFHCPSCKVGVKIKSAKLIGKTISCPKCSKKFQVLTPDEDGHVPYGVEDAIEEMPEPEPTEDELEEDDRVKRKAKRKRTLGILWHATSIVILVGLLGGVVTVFMYREQIRHYIIGDKPLFGHTASDDEMKFE